jgi:hypothetical protein
MHINLSIIHIALSQLLFLNVVDCKHPKTSVTESSFVNYSPL